jgi:hypothetical protein
VDAIRLNAALDEIRARLDALEGKTRPEADGDDADDAPARPARPAKKKK